MNIRCRQMYTCVPHETHNIMLLLYGIGVRHVCTVPKSDIDSQLQQPVHRSSTGLHLMICQVSCFHTSSNILSDGQQPPVSSASPTLSTTAFPSALHARVHVHVNVQVELL